MYKLAIDISNDTLGNGDFSGQPPYRGGMITPGSTTATTSQTPDTGGARPPSGTAPGTAAALRTDFRRFRFTITGKPVTDWWIEPSHSPGPPQPA